MREHSKREAYPRGKAPNDAPSTFKNPGYSKQRKAAIEADQARYDSLCGPVTVRKVEPSDDHREHVNDAKDSEPRSDL